MVDLSLPWPSLGWEVDEMSLDKAWQENTKWQALSPVCVLRHTGDTLWRLSEWAGTN